MADALKFNRMKTPISELEAAWIDRWEDSKALRRSRRYAMSMALGYYALEILLKVRICRHLSLSHLPEAFEYHDLQALLILTRLRPKIHSDSQVKTNWDKLKELVGKVDILRYGPGNQKRRKDADAFHHSLWESEHGVIPWLKIQL